MGVVTTPVNSNHGLKSRRKLQVLTDAERQVLKGLTVREPLRHHKTYLGRPKVTERLVFAVISECFCGVDAAR